MGVETKSVSVAQGQKCNVTSVNRADLLQVWDEVQKDVIKDDMLLFHLLHVDRREPELVSSMCATFTIIQFSITLQISPSLLFT